MTNKHIKRCSTLVMSKIEIKNTYQNRKIKESKPALQFNGGRVCWACKKTGRKKKKRLEGNYKAQKGNLQPLDVEGYIDCLDYYGFTCA